MTKLGENFFPKTTTAAVVDETSGKTLEAMLPLVFPLRDGEVVTREVYDALNQAIESDRQIIVLPGESFSPMSAVGMKGEDGQSVVLTIQLNTPFITQATPIYIKVGEIPTADNSKTLYMVTAGQGVEITGDGTINCTLDTSPFIIPSDGNLPETGEEGKIYLIPATITGDQNVMLEYIWVNGSWEKFGEFKTEVDLSQYAKTEETVKVIDLEAYSGQERIDLIDQYFGNALYRYGGLIYHYVGSYSTHRCFVSFESTNDLAMIQQDVIRVKCLSASPTTLGLTSQKVAYTSALSAYAKTTYVDDAINNAMAAARTLSESAELSPKTYNVLGTLAADTVLTMNAGLHTVPEYQGEFSFGDTVYAVTFPEEVIWNVTPAYLPNKRYQFSILNGLGVMCEFPLSNETSE